ncbi:hypothetical protein BDY17DRAFT_227846, partial [Neohortaea acidophila]
YLAPSLARNERLRLNRFWYYTRGMAQDTELLHRIQEKVNLVRDFLGWEIALCGLLDNDVFERLVSAGMLPGTVRRMESPCSHTIVQPPGTMLLMADMANDWRFKNSPQVVHGGLRSYGGTQLLCKTENGEEVALGSLCVASGTPGRTLSPEQQDILKRFSTMVSGEVINQCRWNRQKEQQRMNQLVNSAISDCELDTAEECIMRGIKQIYPEQDVLVVATSEESIPLSNGQLLPVSETHAGLWENAEELDALILSRNHQPLTTDKFVRAISGASSADVGTKYFLVASKDIRRVFDDIDVSFIEKCTSALNIASHKASLREALKIKEEFLRSITHQLRTPIHGVLGSVDLLAEELAASAVSRATGPPPAMESRKEAINTDEVIATIRNSGKELMSTLNNVIKLHRWTERGYRDGMLREVDLRELENFIMDDALSVLPDDSDSMVRIVFDNRLSPEMKGLTTNDTLLRECVQSIVLNAVQATSIGEVVITISTSEDNSYFRIDVEDTGCGVPVADHQRIFEAYEKADSHTRGVGLGLTLARKMAESINGSLTLVTSVVGKGSHFRAEIQNPAFTFAAVQPASPLPMLDLYVVNPSLESLSLRHIAPCLAKYSCRVISEPANTVAWVSWRGDAQELRKALLRAQQGWTVGICFLPVGERLQDLKAEFPNILFATGPFTTKRMEQALLSARKAFKKSQASSDALARSISIPGALTPKSQTDTPILTNGIDHSADWKPHCLLVDDNDVNLRLLRMYCGKRGMSYTLATDGLQACAAYEAAAASTNPVELILLDLQMPNRNGLQACLEIRKFEQEKGLTPARIFIVTGQDSEKDKEQTASAGANEFFVKPLSFKVLDRNIAAYF